jgi:hypothetical protein
MKNWGKNSNESVPTDLRRDKWKSTIRENEMKVKGL